ncbi:FusB/FusC family EF-G-binding protein [Saccharibacillus sp. CPCC 101409]|nr:FusB/FusC family EF-G-binding protein [Saccharibacillus sp. CPCC 101409]MDO3410560.1 FusB/FusC family EF-G-binding protein [Saccharibacillus sp. CPCC 101409]
MQNAFIHNVQLNIIKKQANFVVKTMRGITDRIVLQTVKETAAAKAVAAFDELTEEQKTLLERITACAAEEEIADYLESLEAYLIPFPEVTPNQIQKLFPKAKKLKVLELAIVDYAHTTYLRWSDIATNRLFIVYPYADRLLGVEGRITAANKRGFCMFCNRHRELGLFNVKKDGVSPDSFSSVGKYICMDHEACNHSITDTTALENFLLSVGK